MDYLIVICFIGIVRANPKPPTMIKSNIFKKLNEILFSNMFDSCIRMCVSNAVAIRIPKKKNVFH
jgi:hypothetical protein